MFICNNFNFEHGEDGIVLVGFSRGAFTVRCAASLIAQVGLLKKSGLVHLYKLYNMWSSQNIDKRPIADLGLGLTLLYKLPPTLKPLEQQIKQLEAAQCLTRQIRIKACAVWDTVSALGLLHVMAKMTISSRLKAWHLLTHMSPNACNLPPTRLR